METITKKENKIVFEAEISESLANSIRRYVNHIPILAVDEVEISKNDSPLYDETLAHRIGLVPLKMKKTAGKSGKDIELTLNVDKEGTVYSGNLQGEIEPVYDNMPLTILKQNQELKLKGLVRKGIGKTHSKFSPGLIFYRHKAEIKLDKEFEEKVKNLCPENEIKDAEGGKNIIVYDNKEKEVADLCEGLAEKEGKEAEVSRENKLIISLESFGQLKPEEMFNESIKNLKNDLNEVSKKLK